MATKPTTSMQDHARKVLAHQEAQTEPEHEGAVPADASFVMAAEHYDVVKRVTTPALPFPTGATYVLRILEPVRTSEVEDSRFGPARVSEVEALNGDVRMLIWNEVFHTAMQRAYPKDSYVGRWFQITKLPGKEGKRGKYADFAIVEIKGPAQLAAAE